jgi:hypothetical protein
MGYDKRRKHDHLINKIDMLFTRNGIFGRNTIHDNAVPRPFSSPFFRRELVAIYYIEWGGN